MPVWQRGCVALSHMPHDIAGRHRRDAARPRSESLEARYVNYFEVGHSAFEFIVDFGQYQPEQNSARMHTRIATGPVYAKLLAELLRGAVERFEEQHGAIQPADDDLDPLDIVSQSIAGYDHRSSGSRGDAKKSDSKN